MIQINERVVVVVAYTMVIVIGCVVASVFLLTAVIVVQCVRLASLQILIVRTTARYFGVEEQNFALAAVMCSKRSLQSIKNPS